MLIELVVRVSVTKRVCMMRANGGRQKFCALGVLMSLSLGDLADLLLLSGTIFHNLINNIR